jgi:hypothetical protein
VFCQVKTSTTGRSLIQRSPTEWVYVSVCVHMRVCKRACVCMHACARARVCVCHWVWSSSIITLYTYSVYVAKGQN